MKIFAFLLMLIPFFQTSFADKVQNTGYLYRVDTRSPSEIFANGFQALGTNDNVSDHVRGISCQQREATSAFISTSADPTWAANYALRIISQGHFGFAYVYIIRSTSNIYSMSRSIQRLEDHRGLDTAEAQSEWIGVNSIPANAIQGVRIYDLNTFSTPPITPNPNYSSVPAPVVNTNPYISTDEQPTGGNEVYLAQRNPMVGFCMAATSWCSSSTSAQKSLTSKDKVASATRSCNFYEENRYGYMLSTAIEESLVKNEL